MVNLNDYCIWDVEVINGPDEVEGGWDNPEEMKLASAVVYDYREDRYHFFLHEEQKPALIALLQTKVCVGFNSIQFDSRVVQGNRRAVATALGHMWVTRTRSAPKGVFVLSTIYHKDLLVAYLQSAYGLPNDWKEIQKTLNRPEIHDGTFTLDGLCQATLGKKKLGHGAHAPVLYHSGAYAELLEYNLQDVRLTKELFEYTLTQRKVTNLKGQVVPMKLHP